MMRWILLLIMGIKTMVTFILNNMKPIQFNELNIQEVEI